MNPNIALSIPADLSHSTLITPAFPNWERSFVSGPESPLFTLTHSVMNGDPRTLVTRVQFLAKAEGPPGNVHGGATAGLLDEVMGVVIWNQKVPCVTEKLSLNYLRGVPLKKEAIVISRIMTDDFHHEKRIEIHSTIFGEKETALVTAQGLFHRLTEAQLAKFKAISETN